MYLVLGIYTSEASFIYGPPTIGGDQKQRYAYITRYTHTNNSRVTVGT